MKKIEYLIGKLIYSIGFILLKKSISLGVLFNHPKLILLFKYFGELVCLLLYFLKKYLLKKINIK